MKNYKNFTTKRYGSLNEGFVKETFAKVYKWIVNKFKNSAWYYLNKFLEKTGILGKNNIKVIDFTDAPALNLPSEVTEGYEFKEIEKLFEQLKEVGLAATDKIPNVSKKPFLA